MSGCRWCATWSLGCYARTSIDQTSDVRKGGDDAIEVFAHARPECHTNAPAAAAGPADMPPGSWSAVLGPPESDGRRIGRERARRQAGRGFERVEARWGDVVRPVRREHRGEQLDLTARHAEL